MLRGVAGSQLYCVAQLLNGELDQAAEPFNSVGHSRNEVSTLPESRRNAVNCCGAQRQTIVRRAYALQNSAKSRICRVIRPAIDANG
jgi:hypothetical protein